MPPKLKSLFHQKVRKPPFGNGIFHCSCTKLAPAYKFSLAQTHRKILLNVYKLWT